MKKIKFTKVSPSENMTILVENPIPIDKQYMLAQRIMDYNHIGGEQVGFFMPIADRRADYGLRMMGGEFCGNATLSLGAWAMLHENPNAHIGYKKNYLLEISGAEKLVHCSIEKIKKGYYGKVEMPLPVSIVEREFSYRTKTYTLPVVEFKGISHIIFDESIYFEASDEAVEEMAILWRKYMPEAFGILLWSFDEEEEKEMLRPYVTVKNHGVWERSCASGVSAIGAYLAYEDEADYSCDFNFLETNNIIHVDVTLDGGRDNEIRSIFISGNIDIVATGIGLIE